LLRDRLSRLRFLILPKVLKMIAGLPKVGTEEKKLPDRFRSVRF